MKVHTFKICQVVQGREEILFPTLIELNQKKYLVDCGYEETFTEFVRELAKLQVAITDLHAILLSHDDIDHLGALTLFKDQNPNLKIYSSYVEAPAISGELKSERLQQAENSLINLPPEHQEWAKEFIRRLQNIKRTAVDGLLSDNQKIDEEIEVLFTPGHTQGHISFYIASEQLLIANDALVVADQGFDIANPAFTLDLPQAIKSAERIKQLRPRKIICYHGGIVEENVDEKLAALLQKYATSPGA
ncbi:MBL fold metallo-hydrolase [Adhaeribacter swui]|uniref:MBL fold metallo-hydrolase n=1 Tax=Adhaeribacter swui TaxID=2086471 RepID=A0A7G7GFD7_9BACT|nr:MBL fold metallo-hydrolase [Adhaeribacter swui]